MTDTDPTSTPQWIDLVAVIKAHSNFKYRYEARDLSCTECGWKIPNLGFKEFDAALMQQHVATEVLAWADANKIITNISAPAPVTDVMVEAAARAWFALEQPGASWSSSLSTKAKRKQLEFARAALIAALGTPVPEDAVSSLDPATAPAWVPDGFTDASWHVEASNDAHADHTVYPRHYVIKCEWCPSIFVGRTKAEALPQLEAHRADWYARYISEGVAAGHFPDPKRDAV